MIWHLLKTAVVTVIIFCGSAFSIMAFNNDVDVSKLFGQIYELVIGKERMALRSWRSCIPSDW